MRGRGGKRGRRGKRGTKRCGEVSKNSQAESSRECRDSAERYVRERGDGNSLSLCLQAGHILCCVSNVKHPYTAIQASVQVVRVIHIPCTCPDWTRGLVATRTQRVK